MQTRQVQIEKTEGVVESAVQNSPTRYGVRIGGVWYNGFGKVRVSKGDLVGVAYTNSDGYNNIEEIAVLDPEEILPEEKPTEHRQTAAHSEMRDTRDARITRAVALKSAVVLYQSRTKNDSDETVLKTAEKFEKWLSAASPSQG